MEYDNVKHRKTPLPNVEIAVANAGSTISDSCGYFTLHFRQLNPGDKIKVRRISKPGYEIFNTAVLEQWSISRDTIPFEILLIRSEKLAKMRQNMISKANHLAEKEYEKSQKELKLQYRQHALKEEEYQLRLKELSRSYEQKLEDIDNYIDRFVHIDQTELSEQDRLVMELAEEGKFAEAIAIYEKAKLVDKFILQQENIQQLTSDEQTIQKAQNEIELQQKKLLNSIKHQIELLKLLGGKENFDHILEILHEVAYADTANLYPMFLYGRHLRDQGHYEQALQVYKTLSVRAAFANDSLDEQRARMFTGIILNKMNQYEAALPILLDATQQLERINRQQPDTIRYIDDIALGYHTIGYAMALHFEHEKGARYLWKSVQLLERMMKSDRLVTSSYKLQYAMMLVKSAEVLRNSRWTNQCLPAINKAIPIIEELYQHKPYLYAFSLAYAWETKGLIYFTLGDAYLADTEHAYQVALTYFDESAELNPEAYNGEKARCELNLAKFYFSQKKLDQAIERYSHCMILLEEESDSNEPYSIELAETYFDLGSCYYFKNMYEKTLELDLKALQITEPLYKHNPLIYRAQMSRSLRHLARTYDALGDNAEALKYIQWAMSVNPENTDNRQLLLSIQQKIDNKE